MKAVTNYSLRHPIATIMAIFCLIYFGVSSVIKAPLELSPEMEMPVLMIMTAYPGASPDDVEELITKKFEDEAGSLSGLKTISSTSSENISMVMLQYEYGTDINEAYDEVKKHVDLVAANLPDGAETPVIIEAGMEATADVMLAAEYPGMENLYTYVKNEIVPELEKIPEVAEVSVLGGAEEYIKVELITEKVSQYKVNIASIVEDIRSSNITYPAGDIRVGSQKVAVSTRLGYDTVELLKEVPLTVSDGSAVYLEDVANVYASLEEKDSIARYNGSDTVSIAITRQQSVTAVDLSNAVKKTVNELMAREGELKISIASDSADSIMTSLRSALVTLVLAVLIAMVIIWLFFGDIKASLIVGSSIPFSILTALIMITAMGFSLNMITMNSLTLGVGMMVDNSIVVLESCFRATDKRERGFLEYMEDALSGTDLVSSSILGGTITTCVVFLPLALLNGMTGQVFNPLGYTIVFCMTASFISASTVVPLCYLAYKPKERGNTPLSGLVNQLQEYYRKCMRCILKKKKTVMAISLGLLGFACFLATKLNVELMASDDQGIINITVETRPGLITNQVDEVLREIESVIAVHPDLKSYMTSYGGDGGLQSGTDAVISAILKDDRKMETKDVISQWKRELAAVKNCNISVDMSASISMMDSGSADYEVILQGANYDRLLNASQKIAEELKQRDDVIKIHSDMEQSTPTVEIKVDALKARAAGLNAAGIGSTVRNMITGAEATDIEIAGDEITVRVEYADDEYQTIDQIQEMVLSAPNGGFTALTDLAEVRFVDSAASITRKNKQYVVTISGLFTELADENTEEDINKSIILPNLESGISIGSSSSDDIMGEEFPLIFGAIATAVILVFVVMAVQFDSIKYSVMVMTTIPFSLIGAFGLLYLTNCKISMVSLIGFLILIGTVVNNGILFVDTANQYRQTMDIDTALVEAGAVRIRPILMTTLTTVIAMIPMAMALGNAGSMTQGLAIVNIGGMTASTLLALLMLPVYYKLMSGKKG